MTIEKSEKKLSFTEFMEKVAIYRQETKQRRGQAFFNVLVMHRPDLSEQMRGNMKIDPFYRDSLLSEATRWVRGMW